MNQGNKAGAVAFEESPSVVPTGQISNAVLGNRGSILTFGLLGLLLVACYYPMLLQTGRTIALSDDMAYGFFAPIVAAYVTWSKRAFLVRPEAPSSAWCIASAGFGACIGTIATLANSSTFSRFGLLLSLAGCLLWAGGGKAFATLHLSAKPVAFSPFPIPDVLYGEISSTASSCSHPRLAESTFEILGFSVIREGNILAADVHEPVGSGSLCSGAFAPLITLVFFLSDLRVLFLKAGSGFGP